jgi:hypothetical protein
MTYVLVKTRAVIPIPGLLQWCFVVRIEALISPKYFLGAWQFSAETASVEMYCG